MQAFLTEDQLARFPRQIQAHFHRLETDVIERICARLQEIGKLTASDVHLLDELRRIGFDLEAIRAEVADTLAMSEREVYRVFREAAQHEYAGQQASFVLTGMAYTPFDENLQLQALIRSISSATAGRFVNFANTTGFVNVRNSVGVLVNGYWQPLAQYYQSVVDYSILQIRIGQTDFHSAIRSSIRAMADHGFSFVEYDNEGKRRYVRRLDSSVRNAIMGGQAELSWAQAQLVGQQFGATGYEVSWHSAPRASHAWIGGRQFSLEEFHEQVLPLLQEPNCYHRALPIVLGVSAPAYSQEQIAALNGKDAERRTYNGKEYDARAALDRQREIETRIRQYKDRAIAARSIGDEDERKAARAQVTNWQSEYRQFSDAMNVYTRPNRTSVAGYR